MVIVDKDQASWSEWKHWGAPRLTWCTPLVDLSFPVGEVGSAWDPGLAASPWWPGGKFCLLWGQVGACPWVCFPDGLLIKSTPSQQGGLDSSLMHPVLGDFGSLRLINKEGNTKATVTWLSGRGDWEVSHSLPPQDT